MILEITKFNFLNDTVAFKIYAGSTIDSFEKILVDNKEIDLSSVDELNKVIDILKQSLKNDLDLCSFNKEENDFLNVLGLGSFKESLEKMYNKNRDNINAIIDVINSMISKLMPKECVCKSCDLLDVCSSQSNDADCEIGICPDNGCEECNCEVESAKYCEECCTCVDDKYCTACQEAEKASKSVEAVSNTRTFHWAQKYMDTVIDPASELTGPEYNTLLAMFTQYGEWILQQ